MIELTPAQHLAIAENGEEHPRASDPQTGTTYVLVRADVYDRMKAIVDGITRRAAWDDPKLDEYERYPEDAMERGEIVLVDWPYSDRTGSKLRPAVFVQADFLNGVIDDTVLVQVTSTRHGLPGTEARLDPAAEAASGLLHVCYANGTNLLTAEQALIDQVIGWLSDGAMREIDSCLKTVLSLP